MCEDTNGPPSFLSVLISNCPGTLLISNCPHFYLSCDVAAGGAAAAGAAAGAAAAASAAAKVATTAKAVVKTGAAAEAAAAAPAAVAAPGAAAPAAAAAQAAASVSISFEFRIFPARSNFPSIPFSKYTVVRLERFPIFGTVFKRFSNVYKGFPMFLEVFKQINSNRTHLF